MVNTMREHYGLDIYVPHNYRPVVGLVMFCIAHGDLLHSMQKVSCVYITDTQYIYYDVAQIINVGLFLCSNLEYASHYLCQQCHETSMLFRIICLSHGIVDKDNEMHTPS